jgi:type I restriction enzyme S subunit
MKVSLDEVAQWGSGGTPSRKNPDYFVGDIPWLKTGELGQKYIRQTEEKISQEAVNSSAAKLFPKGSVCIAMYGATIGKASILCIDATTNQACAVGQPLTGVLDAEFLYYFFISEKHRFIEAGIGGAQPNISQGLIKSWPFTLPPLAEQKRVVVKIEELFSELDAGEQSLRLARRQLGVYRQSLLKQAFEGKLTEKWRAVNREKLETPEQFLARIQSERVARSEAKSDKQSAIVPFPRNELVGQHSLPAEWIVLAYGGLCSIVRNGISQKPTGEFGYKITRISAVRPMAFDYEDYRFIDCDSGIAFDYLLASGDLVFTRYNGARRFVGVCAEFKSKEPRLYPDKLIRTRPNLPSLDPRYLEIALNCGLSRAWLETKIRTTAGQSGVSGGDIKAMPVPLCPLPEQQEIVRLLDEQFEVIERNEREIDAALRRSEALRQAILIKAFTGQLVPQDSDDEPASVLLARLRAQKQPKPIKQSKKNA